MGGYYMILQNNRQDWRGMFAGLIISSPDSFMRGSALRACCGRAMSRRMVTMNRREFLRIGSMGLMSFALAGCGFSALTGDSSGQASGSAGLAAGWLFLYQIAVQEDISREEYVRLSQEIVEQSRTQSACMAPDEP